MIQSVDLLRVLGKYRGNAVVVSGRMHRHWLHISTRPTRDVPLGDPAMGGHASFALGLALAVPHERVFLFDSEGDLQMNLGALANIAEQQPRNFYHFLLDNECYATTGGQPVPNARDIKYDVIARGAGYPHTFAFDDLEDFSNNIGEVLRHPGPVFVAVKIVPEIENEPIGRRVRPPVRPREQVLRELQQELGIAAAAPR